MLSNNSDNPLPDRDFLFLLILIFIFSSCGKPKGNDNSSGAKPPGVYLIVLGTLQDGGSPHIGCKKDCCKELFSKPDPCRKVVSLGIIDQENKKSWLIEATPDIATQLKLLMNISKSGEKETPDGIFLTHAHIGHYAGLMYLGKE